MMFCTRVVIQHRKSFFDVTGLCLVGMLIYVQCCAVLLMIIVIISWNVICQMQVELIFKYSGVRVKGN